MKPAGRPAEVVVRFLAGLASLSAFFYYYGHGQVLLYGDAVAHINIARRVFDSRTPGPLQLGTVWLPLPHLLIMPFVVSDSAWRSGMLASLPFMFAYVFAVLGTFRLVRDGLSALGVASRHRDLGAIFAAAVFGCNPNLLYMQATAMTESLYLALFIWTVVYLCEYREHLAAHDYQRASKPLARSAVCLAGSMLTRYDGWFAGAFVFLILLLTGMRALWRESEAASNSGKRELAALAGFRKRLILALSLIIVVPGLWMAYNALVFGNALDFANGPYSARGIAERTSPGHFHHPGYHNLWVAGVYFLKSAQLTLANGWWAKLWLVAAAIGSLLAIARWRRLALWLLLWLPLPFYVLSIAYGGTPIFMPVWWPHSYYNVRYGLELLPAVSVFAGLALAVALWRLRSTSWSFAVPAAAFVCVAATYAAIWRAQPICLQEAIANSRTRIPFEAELAKHLDRLPPRSTILMYIGDHVGALQRAGIPLRRVIHEGNHGDWEHALARIGLWESALAAPGRFADYAVAFDDDAVARSARDHHLPSLVVIETTGQPRAVIYQTHPWPR